MDQKTILRDYRELRSEMIALIKPLVSLLAKKEFLAAAFELGILRGKDKIDLEAEDELVVLSDYAIHNVFLDGENAVDRMLQTSPSPAGSTKQRLLRAMQESHYTILEVISPIPGLGVRAADGPDRHPILLVDVGLSKSTLPGTALAARILSAGDDWWMTTGAALPLNEAARTEIIGQIQKFTDRHGREPPEQKLQQIITRACLAAGASRQIRYAGPGAATAAAGPGNSLRQSPKIGRNDPCPCGSGKKHKKCCGG